MLVGVLVPSQEHWHARMAISLIGATSYLLQEGVGFFVQNSRGSILPQLRQRLVEAALERGATHLFMVDSDQTFPPETIVTLLRHNVPFVALNVPTKQRAATPTARRQVGGKWEVVCSTPTSPRLGEVNRIGLGIALARADVFARLERPWFGIRWCEEIQDFEGEDWWFCRRLEDAGVPILIDHRLSLQIGHIGPWEYTHNDVKRYSGSAEGLCQGPRLVEDVRPAAAAPGDDPAA